MYTNNNTCAVGAEQQHWSKTMRKVGKMGCQHLYLYHISGAKEMSHSRMMAVEQNMCDLFGLSIKAQPLFQNTDGVPNLKIGLNKHPLPR